MNAAFNSAVRFAASVRDGAARFLIRLRVRPLHLTVSGLLLSCLSGWLFFAGRFRAAAVILLVSGACDLLDGAVARLSGAVTAFGAFLDSTVDRASDAAVLCGILLYYNRSQADTYSVLAAYLALVGSFLVSYTRARAECIIDRCSTGFFQRPERIIALAVAGIAGVVPAVLWLLAAATGFTALQRILYVRRSVRNDGGKNSKPPGGPPGRA